MTVRSLLFPLLQYVLLENINHNHNPSVCLSVCCERVYLCVHKDRALPIAVKTSSVRSQLRLCNKLSELLLQLGQCSEAIEYTQTALEISLSLGRLTHVHKLKHTCSTVLYVSFVQNNV